ncbi:MULTISPECIES: hypothetical protein [Halocynthiibacter]|uniref:Uncharacterized protein n=1 Tax=Halocynthiibacter halioticoli TaxID=2986804 RepID=A0AAE3J0H1_9RHOB|nr:MULTISPECIES: hypothetical protein [Halocynthiibacter]MCV6825399.1 hypothetical protein [Halocynthiibacter halioticoli]MCW4058400.1 hypothetical protein [Halocynthiibacter sp. SDUM655004]
MLHMSYLLFMAKNTVYHIKKLVNLTEEQAERIADYRFSERINSENEAIRRLIELGLQAHSVEKKDG